MQQNPDNPNGQAARVSNAGYASQNDSPQPTQPLGGQPTQQVYVPPELRPNPPNYVPTTNQVPPPPNGAPSPDRRYRQRGMPVVGPLLLILAGIVFLLNNFGYLDWSMWDYLWRLWPLVLIAIGLELIIGRRRPGLAAIIVLVVFAVGIAMIARNGAFGAIGNITSQQLNVPLSGVEAADVSIEMGIGELRVNSAETTQLASGTLEYYENQNPPEVTSSTTGGAAMLNIRQRGDGLSGMPFFGKGKSPTWDVRLTQKVPVSLSVNTGTGQATLDLTLLKLQTLTVDAGTGQVTVDFPENVGTSHAEINGGTGSIDVTIPQSVEAMITVSSGLGSVTLDKRFAKNGDVYKSNGYDSATNKLDLSIDQGVGSVTVGSR